MYPFFCFPNIQEIDLLFEDVDFYTCLTHAHFEELCQDPFQSTLDPDEKELRYSMVNKLNVHKIILVNGSTHIPLIVKLVSDFFNSKEPNKSINPDEAVAYSVAIPSGNTEKTQDLLLNIVPLPLVLRLLEAS